MGLSEDQVLARIAVEQALEGLAPVDRCMMLLVYEISFPDDWGDRAVTYTTIGEYVGMRFESRPLSEAAIRYRRDEIVKMLRGERGEIRRRKPKVLRDIEDPKESE